MESVISQLYSNLTLVNGSDPLARASVSTLLHSISLIDHHLDRFHRSFLLSDNGSDTPNEGREELERGRQSVLRCMADWCKTTHPQLQTTHLLHSLHPSLSLPSTTTTTTTTTTPFTPFVSPQTISSPSESIQSLAKGLPMDVYLNNEDPDFGMKASLGPEGAEITTGGTGGTGEVGGAEGIREGRGKRGKREGITLGAERVGWEMDLFFPFPSSSSSSNPFPSSSARPSSPRSTRSTPPRPTLTKSELTYFNPSPAHSQPVLLPSINGVMRRLMLDYLRAVGDCWAVERRGYEEDEGEGADGDDEDAEEIEQDPYPLNDPHPNHPNSPNSPKSPLPLPLGFGFGTGLTALPPSPALKAEKHLVRLRSNVVVLTQLDGWLRRLEAVSLGSTGAIGRGGDTGTTIDPNAIDLNLNAPQPQPDPSQTQILTDLVGSTRPVDVTPQEEREWVEEVRWVGRLVLGLRLERGVD